MFQKKDTYFGEDFTAELCEKQKDHYESGSFFISLRKPQNIL